MAQKQRERGTAGARERVKKAAPTRVSGSHSIRDVPVLVVIAAIITLLFIVAPLLALAGRVEWSALTQQLTSTSTLVSLGLSLGTAFAATIVCALLGVPLAMWIARLGPTAAAAARALVLVPMLMPPLVGGLALLALFGRNGAVGHLFSSLTGEQIPFSTAAVVIAQSYVALPFFVLAVEQAIRAVDPRLELVARGLGASRGRVWRRITLPLIAPAIASGAMLSFSRALAEFGATAMFAGNREGVTRTMPLSIYTAFNGGGVSAQEAYTLSIILVAAAIIVLVALRSWRVGGER